MVEVETCQHAADRLDIAALGGRIRTERTRQRLSLDELAAQAGVSRSMLSAVERGAKVPTILVLHRIATGLGSNVTRLLGEERTAPVILLRQDEQDVARDPTGWERRNLAPVIPGVDFELMRTTIPPGVDAGEFPPHPAGSREYVAVERGSLRLTVAGAAHLLHAGDSIYYVGDCRHAFANPGAETCVYYLALDLPEAGRLNRHAPSVREHRQRGTVADDGAGIVER
jgi:transcriptional regulator with XRE-family HTH domain